MTAKMRFVIVHLGVEVHGNDGVILGFRRFAQQRHHRGANRIDADLPASAPGQIRGPRPPTPRRRMPGRRHM